MKSKLHGKADPIERKIELALHPGAFIRYGECFSFVSGLEEVAATIDKLIATDPVRAAALYESFLAGCHAKADELDDSTGSFGQFAQDLICRWIKARQTAGAERDKIASTLLAWMDDDPYAFCYGIEKDAAAAFDQAGRAAFEKLSRARFEAASEAPAGYEYRRWSDILRAIYCAQRDIQAYIALAEQTGLKPEDCLAVARLFAPRKPAEALAWVERGRALDREKTSWSVSGLRSRQTPPPAADQARPAERSAGGRLGRLSGTPLEVHLRRVDEVRAQDRTPRMARKGS